MPSPFPGMDPYLERHWGDVHADLVALSRTALNLVLPGDLVARMEERVVIEDQHTETYVTILDADGGELVTVIEFLSPANKLPGEGRDQYRHKRNELTSAKVNFVEVDFVRQGSWRESLSPVVAPASVKTAFRAVSYRFHPPKRIELYPLRQSLPSLLIPLREGDNDVSLDLQWLVEQAYRNGRYDRIDYTSDCQPPLEAEDAAWADELLKKAGARRAS